MEKIRSKLLEGGATILEVTKLESAYVSVVKKRSFDGFEKLANRMSPQGSEFIKDLLSSAAISFVLRGIGL